MHFIIPKNFNFKPKLFGIIEYWTALLDIIWAIVLYLIINVLPIMLNIKFYLFVIFFLPFFLFSIIGINNEDIISVVKYLYNYFSRSKIYLYK